jgi:hypothetical protein
MHGWFLVAVEGLIIKVKECVNVFLAVKMCTVQTYSSTYIAYVREIQKLQIFQRTLGLVDIAAPEK